MGDRMRSLFFHRLRAGVAGQKGLTLIECLISMIIIGAVVISILGAYYASRIGTERARHRVTAMNIIRQYIEQEMMAGYEGGNDLAVDNTGYYYDTTPSGGWPVTVTIDDRGTTSTSDDLTGTLNPSPLAPYNIYASYSGPGTGTPHYYPPGQTDIKYKIAGFVVTWNEEVFGRSAPAQCSERALVHLSQHKQ